MILRLSIEIMVIVYGYMVSGCWFNELVSVVLVIIEISWM